MNWSGIPDVAAIALLICAFASVAHHSQRPGAGLWLTGWLMILLHFAAALFRNLPGISGNLASIAASTFLIWAGLLYTYASIPYRTRISSRLMLATLAATGMFYMAALEASPAFPWALNLAAVMLTLGPLAVALASIRAVNNPFRWFIVSLCGSLSIFLLIFQHRPENGADLAWNAVMFTVYIGNCFFAVLTYRRATAGAFVSIAGFFTWAAVFVVAPMMEAFQPQVHIESEVWNLPKFVVAVGMMLLLLEDQIEHNKHLALHDALTGLPNRRLFEDRMASALERSRRTGTGMALLVVDLNDFKQVNDTLGHHVGDLVLQRVAATFAERVRRSDTVSRTGGDEFSVILEEPTNRKEAEYVGRSLQQLLNCPINIDGHKVNVGASIGIAIYPEDAHDSESLCIAADLQMYNAKRRSQESNENMPPATWKPLPIQEAAIGKKLPLAQEIVPPYDIH